jgi:hypothetical protein
MKFTVNLEILLAGLSPVLAISSLGVTQKEYPDAKRITLEGNTTSLLAKAHNGEVAIIVDLVKLNGLDYKFESSGKVSISSIDLEKTLNSFNKTETLLFNTQSTSLEISPLSDLEKIQTLPFEIRDVEVPRLADSFQKEAQIKTDSLLKSISKVSFAMMPQKSIDHSLMIKLKVSPEGISSYCGSNASSFAVYSLEGDNVKTKDTFDFYVYEKQIASVNKFLNNTLSEYVDVKEHINKDTNKNQVVLFTDTSTVFLVGFVPISNYPPLDQVLSKTNKYIYVTNFADFDKELKGLLATYNSNLKDTGEAHISNFSFDSNKKLINLSSQTTMKAKRKVSLLDANIDTENTFRITTLLFENAIKNGTGLVQLEIPESERIIIIRYFAKDKISDTNDIFAETKEKYKERFSYMIGLSAPEAQVKSVKE